MIWSALLVLATFCLFLWLAFAHPLVAAAWFLGACIVTFFLCAALGTFREGDAE